MKDKNDIRSELSQRVLEGSLTPCEAGCLYARDVGLSWSEEDAAESLTSYDPSYYAEEELNSLYDDEECLNELFDWIEENGAPIATQEEEVTR